MMVVVSALVRNVEWTAAAAQWAPPDTPEVSKVLGPGRVMITPVSHKAGSDA